MSDAAISCKWIVARDWLQHVTGLKDCLSSLLLTHFQDSNAVVLEHLPTLLFSSPKSVKMHQIGQAMSYFWQIFIHWVTFLTLIQLHLSKGWQNNFSLNYIIESFPSIDIIDSFRVLCYVDAFESVVMLRPSSNHDGAENSQVDNLQAITWGNSRSDYDITRSELAVILLFYPCTWGKITYEVNWYFVMWFPSIQLSTKCISLLLYLYCYLQCCGMWQSLSCHWDQFVCVPLKCLAAVLYCL